VAVSLEDVANHIDHISQSNARHVAVGRDLDDQSGTEQTPQDVNTIADLQRLPGIPGPRGYSESEIEDYHTRHWLRVFDRALLA
jgi:membrane dipeptidase